MVKGKRWSASEDAALQAGVSRHGTHWVSLYGLRVCGSRSARAMRDRWREVASAVVTELPPAGGPIATADDVVGECAVSPMPTFSPVRHDCLAWSTVVRRTVRKYQCLRRMRCSGDHPWRSWGRYQFTRGGEGFTKSMVGIILVHLTLSKSKICTPLPVPY